MLESVIKITKHLNDGIPGLPALKMYLNELDIDVNNNYVMPYDKSITCYVFTRYENDLNYLREFLTFFAIDVNRIIRWGCGWGSEMTLFQYMCRDNIAIAKMMLELGGDPTKTILDRNALSYAIEGVQVDLVKHFINQMNILPSYEDYLYIPDYVICTDTHDVLLLLMEHLDLTAKGKYEYIVPFFHGMLALHLHDNSNKNIIDVLLQTFPEHHDIYSELYNGNTLVMSYLASNFSTYNDDVSLDLLGHLIQRGVDITVPAVHHVYSKHYTTKEGYAMGGEYVLDRIYMRKDRANMDKLLDLLFSNGAKASKYFQPEVDELFRVWACEKTKYIRSICDALPNKLPDDVKKTIAGMACGLKDGVIKM